MHIQNVQKRRLIDIQWMSAVDVRIQWEVLRLENTSDVYCIKKGHSMDVDND